MNDRNCWGFPTCHSSRGDGMTHEEGEGRQMPTRYTRQGLIAMALLTAFCIACAIAIAYGDRAAIPL